MGNRLPNLFYKQQLVTWNSLHGCNRMTREIGGGLSGIRRCKRRRSSCVTARALWIVPGSFVLGGVVQPHVLGNTIDEFVKIEWLEQAEVNALH